MSVVSVSEIAGRGGNVSLDKQRREYKRVFQVVVNHKDDGQQTVLNAAGLPLLGSPYLTAQETDVGAVLKSVEADEVDHFKWNVTCHDDSDTPDPAAQVENPLLRPPVYRFSFVKEEVVVDRDLDGYPIVNSAGQPFIPAKTVIRSRPQIEVSYNVLTFSHLQIMTLTDTVNSGLWNGWMPYVCLVESITANSAYENGMAFFQKTVTLSINYEGWIYSRFLDEGYAQITNDDNTNNQYTADPDFVPGQNNEYTPFPYDGPARNNLATIRDSAGIPLTQQSLLDGHGHVLPFGQPPVYLEFRLYRTADFNASGLFT